MAYFDYTLILQAVHWSFFMSNTWASFDFLLHLHFCREEKSMEHPAFQGQFEKFKKGRF